jgi:hypothetical protein
MEGTYLLHITLIYLTGIVKSPLICCSLIFLDNNFHTLSPYYYSCAFHGKSRDDNYPIYPFESVRYSPRALFPQTFLSDQIESVLSFYTNLFAQLVYRWEICIRASLCLVLSVTSESCSALLSTSAAAKDSTI